MYSVWLGCQLLFSKLSSRNRKNSLEVYFKNLKIGAVFAYNDDSPKLILVEVVKVKDHSSILVM